MDRRPRKRQALSVGALTLVLTGCGLAVTSVPVLAPDLVTHLAVGGFATVPSAVAAPPDPLALQLAVERLDARPREGSGFSER